MVDIDLDAFFDRVQHDALMARVARRVHDKQVLRLVRCYLAAGVMVDGVGQPSEEGTPQGSPLWPLLASVMLEDLEGAGGTACHREHHAVRRVTAQAAGQPRESAVDRATKQPFLGAAYFALADTPSGIPERTAREWAGSRKGYWRIADSAVLNRALPNAYWAELGLKGFSDPYRRFRDAMRTAGCGPACPAVWEGPG